MTREPLFTFIDNDMVLHVMNVRNITSNQMLPNSLDTSFTLVQSGNNVNSGVVGQTWPTSLVQVNSETAHFIATIVDSCTLTQSEYYQGLLTITASGGFRGNWKLPVQAIHRES